MKAEIISVGTEILLGEIVDTNASWLAARLPALGVDLYFKSVVGDNLDRIVDTLERALDRSDLVIMTGGLGPTDDDLTRESIAAALGEEMYIDEDMSRALEAFFKSRGLGFPERNRKQAGLIPSASAILNPRGTAPGWWVEKNHPEKGDRYIVAMPGVPHEMYRMWENEVEPRLIEIAGKGVLVTRVLKTVGMGESMLDELIARSRQAARTPRSASTPSRTASTSASAPRQRTAKPPASSSHRSRQRPASSSARSSGASTTSRWRARSAPCCASAA